MSKVLEQVLTIEAKGEDEWIAGIPRACVHDGKYWTGFEHINEKEVFDLINQNLSFRHRDEETEQDESFKQIIPYFLIRRNKQFFISKRKNKAGERRLHGLRLVGFGGHLRKEDITGPMSTWLEREFQEELDVEHLLDLSFIGIVNDDSNASNGAGKVHLGLVFVMDVEGNVALKEKDKFEKGEFVTLEKLKTLTDKMESWSKIIVENL